MSNHTTEISPSTIPYGYCQCGCGQKTKIAHCTSTNLGWVKNKPIRYINGHNGRVLLVDNFWSKVDKRGPDDCWMWTAGKLPAGYGVFNIGRRFNLAHRVSWVLSNGPIPDDMCVLHRCDTPGCVNPNHLFLGTKSDNNKDRKAKGRSATGQNSGRHTHPESFPFGEKHSNSKLTTKQVIEIRNLVSNGVEHRHVGKLYDVAHSTVGRIARREIWKHVP